MSHDAKSLQRIYSIEKKLEKNDFTLGNNFHGGGDYNKSQECFSKLGCAFQMVLKTIGIGYPRTARIPDRDFQIIFDPDPVRHFRIILGPDLVLNSSFFRS